MNADRRPIDPAILAAVAEGAMPLAVFGDWLEENDWPANWADCFRKTPHHWQAMSFLRKLLRGKPLRGFTLAMWQWLYPTPYSRRENEPFTRV